MFRVLIDLVKTNSTKNDRVGGRSSQKAVSGYFLGENCFTINIYGYILMCNEKDRHNCGPNGDLDPHGFFCSSRENR